jgi:PAS domain S-box-containing protein
MGEAKEAVGERAPRGGHSWRLGLFVAALALFALLAIALFFLVYAPNQRRQAIGEWARKLEAVANDRKTVIGERVDEILGDARTAASSPSVRAAVAAQKAGSAFVAADRLGEALGVLQPGRRHGGIALFGEGGVWLAGAGRWGSAKEAANAAALLGPEAEVDFVLGADGKPLVVFAAPVGGGKGARAVILVDPTEWFYPLLAREAVPTRTGEVFLARRDGEDVVVLSPLRTRPDAPLKLRIPVSGPTIAARFAAAGIEMAGEFPDHRGVPVVAAARLVPGTGWILVAKVDRDEALESFRTKMRWAAALLLFSIALVGLLAAALAREAGNRSRRSAEASDQRLALLLKEANDAILYSAADGRVLEANPSAVELYGYSRAELLTMSLRDLRPPEGQAELGQQLAAILVGAPPVFETNGLRKDGTIVVVEESVRGTTVEGKPGFTSVIRNVSARKEAERRIAFLNRMVRTHTAVNQLIIRERDQQRLLDGVCRAAVEVAGFRMAWIGMADRTAGLVRPVAVAGHDDGYLSETSVRCDDTIEGRGPTGAAIREGRTVTLDDMRDDPRVEPWREAAARHGYRSSAAFPLVVDGEAIGALSIYSDERAAFIGEIVELLEEMAGDVAFALQVAKTDAVHRKVEERYRLISENAADVIWTLDVATLRFTYVSPSVKRLRGFTPEEVIVQPVESGLSLESRPVVSEELPRQIACFEAGDESYRVAVTRLDQMRRDGTIVPTEVVTTLLADDLGRVTQVLGVSRDITERKRHEDELVRLNEELERRVAERTAELERANQELDEFSSSVSHDLKAPLRAIDGFTGMLAKTCTPKLDEAERHLVSVIRENTQRMSRLIDDLLTFSRTGRSEMQRSHVEMGAMARSVVEEVIPRGTAREQISVTVGELPQAWGDASLLRQVWINLLSNAVKFSAKREGAVIEISGGVENESTVYRVRDNGAGFDMAHAAKLFGVFQRLHRGDEFEGTGIGLALVKRIVSRHGGQVTAQSAPGEGATFTFALPILHGEGVEKD